MKKTQHTGYRGLVDLTPKIKIEYDKYIEAAGKASGWGNKYTYWMLFENILTFLKKKNFDPERRY